MQRIFVVLLGALLLFGCEDSPRGLPEPTPVDSIAPAESVPAPEPASAPAESVAVEPAQLSCVPSLTVNGILADGKILREGIPSKLFIEVSDCPHPKQEARDRGAARTGWGGASTGFGSGEVHVTANSLLGAIAFSPKSPVTLEGAIRVDGQSKRMITVITRPSRGVAPNRVDTPVRYTQSVGVKDAGTDHRAYVWVEFFPADAGVHNCRDENGVQKCFGIQFRQER